MEIFKPGRVYDFMGMRTFWIALSLFLTFGSAFAAVVYPGPNYGTDFKGGTEVEVAFLANVTSGEVRAAVEKGGFAEAGSAAKHFFSVQNWYQRSSTACGS